MLPLRKPLARFLLSSRLLGLLPVLDCTGELRDDARRDCRRRAWATSRGADRGAAQAVREIEVTMCVSCERACSNLRRAYSRYRSCSSLASSTSSPARLRVCMRFVDGSDERSCKDMFCSNFYSNRRPGPGSVTLTKPQHRHTSHILMSYYIFVISNGAKTFSFIEC